MWSVLLFCSLGYIPLYLLSSSDPEEFEQENCCNPCRAANCCGNKRWEKWQLNIENKVYYPPYNKPKNGIYDNLPQHQKNYDGYNNERNRRNQNPVISRKAFRGFGSAAYCGIPNETCNKSHAHIYPIYYICQITIKT